MKYKKLMIVGLLLLAILTIGAVSASEDVNSTDTLTVETMDEVSVDASDDEIVSIEDEQMLESSDTEVQSVGNSTSVPEIDVDVQDVEYGEPAVVNITVKWGPGEGNLLVNLDDESTYNVIFMDDKASQTFENLDVGTHTVTVTYEGNDFFESATATASFEVFEPIEPGSYFDVNSDLITFREIVTLLHYKVGDNATGVLTIRNKDIPAWVFFRKSISEMEYNYQMKGYKFDQYDGYVVFKEDLENATTGEYNLEITYEEDGRIIDSVETTVYLDFKSESINGETDINKDENILTIHIPQSYNNGALVLSWGNILYPNEAGDPDLMLCKVINITNEMLGQELTFKRSDLDLNEEGDYSLDARYVSYDEFEFMYLAPDDEWPEDTYWMGIADNKALYLKYIGDENDHYAFYWKTRYLQDYDFVIVVDNTKFRAKVESTSLLDKNGKLLVYCPEGTAGETIRIEANQIQNTYTINEDGKYAEFDLADFRFTDVGTYTFSIYDNDNNLILDYEYTFENPLEIPERAIMGTNDFMLSTVVYLVVPDGTTGIVTIRDDVGNQLFVGFVDQLDVLTEKEQIDNQFYGEEGILNRYYILDSKLDGNFTSGTYNLTAEFQEINMGSFNVTMPQQSTAHFSKNAEIKLIERKYVESDGVSIELFDYEDHRFCDEEDWIAVIHAHYFNEHGTVWDPSQDDVIINVGLVDEEGNEKIYNFQLEEDDGDMSCGIWIDDDELAPGDYVVTVTYYYNGAEGNFISISSNMTFVGDDDDDEDGPIDDVEFCPPESEEEFEIGEDVVVAHLYIPESWNNDVQICVYRGEELLYTENTANIEPGYDDRKEAKDYPITLDLTQLVNKDVIYFTFDYWGDDVSWAEAVQVDGDKVIFWDDPDFERFEFSTFYGNLTTGGFNNPDMMGAHFEGRSMIITISDFWEIEDGTITVSDGETTFFTKQLSEIADKHYDFRSLGFEYVINPEEFSLMSLPEDVSVTFTLAAGDKTISQKRIRQADYVYVELTPDDVGRLFDVGISDRDPFDAIGDNDPFVSIVATDDANRQSVLFDLGEGQFKVYVNDEEVEGLGEKILENWIINSGILEEEDEGYLVENGIDPEVYLSLDEDGKISYLHEVKSEDFGYGLQLFRLCSVSQGCRELYLSAQDLGITEAGTYNIKIAYVLDDYEPEPGVPSDDFIYHQDTLLVEKDLDVVFDRIETSLSADDLFMTYKDGSAWTVTLTDVNANPIANAIVKIGILDRVYDRKTNADGVASLPINLAIGIYDMTASFEGDLNYASSSVSASIYVNYPPATLSAEDIIMVENDGTEYTLFVTDSNGNPIADVPIMLEMGDEGVYIQTNEEGRASRPIDLYVGVYDFTATFEGSDTASPASIVSKVTVCRPNAAVLSTGDLEMCYKDGSAWTVTLTDASGNPMSNAIVKIGIVGKVYNRKTDANGVASLPINLGVGVYDINATFDGDANHQSAFARATVTVKNPAAILSAEDVVMVHLDGSEYAVTLTDPNGNPIANTIVKINIIGITYDRRTDENGVATLPINLAAGVYDITATFEGNARYSSASIANTVFVNTPDTTTISADDLVMCYRDGSAWTVTLTDARGNPIVNSVVKIGIIGKYYTKMTDANGVARLTINLKAGVYDVNATFDGDEIHEAAFTSASITVKQPAAVLTADDVVMNYRDGTSYDVTLTDPSGSPIANSIVKITVVGKTYNVRTNENGVASLPINLAAGTYDITARFEGNSQYSDVEIANTIVVNRA